MATTVGPADGAGLFSQTDREAILIARPSAITDEPDDFQALRDAALHSVKVNKRHRTVVLPSKEVLT